MPVLYRNVMREQCYPEKDCFTLWHTNGQEFRDYEDDELILDFLKIQEGSLIQLYLVDPEASLFKNLVPLKAQEETTIIIGKRNFFDPLVVNNEGTQYELNKVIFSVSRSIHVFIFFLIFVYIILKSLE